jgi:RNA polymerase sigma-70 factor (ECF subfamily)
MSDGKSDIELVAEFKAGKEASFEELVNRYSSKAFSLASRLTRNQEDAEEVLQDVFVTVYRKIDGFEGKSSFSSWLYRITVNSALMKLRRRKRDQTTSIEEVIPQLQNSPHLRTSEQAEGDAATLRAQLNAALEDAIRKLPDDYRPVFILRDIDGLTSREVSKILQLTVPAVKSRLHRSRLMLRRRLSRLYRELRTGPVPSAGNM